MANQTKREQIQSRLSALKSERASWLMRWRELSTFILPVNGRYFAQDRNKGWRRHNDIYDSTGTRAARILAAGLMSYMTSPARPWFALSTMDEELAENLIVREWLDDCAETMRQIFNQGNTYRVLHSMYEELGVFGTAVAVRQEDYNDVIRLNHITIGEYGLATNGRSEVDTLYREYEMTVGAMAKEFGLKNCSVTVRNLHDRGSLDTWVRIIHAIEPREDREYGKKDKLNKPFRSCYMELASDSREQLLREGGYDDFPALAPRWSTIGGDIYGVGPGSEAIGDIKQLQHQQLRKAEAIDYQTNPPLQVPTSLKNREVERFPGGVTYYDNNTPQGGIRPMFEVQLNLQYLLADIQDTRTRINSAFYADMFLMLSNGIDPRMTATEVAERHEEKMLMLGPVVERLHNELLDPLVTGVFQSCLKGGIFPPPPRELQGQELKVQFNSVLAQAQQAVGTGTIDRFVSSLGMIAQVKPEVLDRFDADQWVEVYSDKLGVDPELIVPGDKAALIRQDRAKQQQAAQSAAALNSVADTVGKLGSVPTDGDSMGGKVMNMFTGYGA